MSEEDSPPRRDRFVGADPPRVVVVAAEGPAGMREAEAGTGVVPFSRGGDWFLAVVVKLCLGDTGKPLLSMMAPHPFTLDVASRFAEFDPALLDRASDFALFKANADVLIVGHARTLEPTAVMQPTLTVLSGDGEPVFSATVVVRAGAPTTQIPLAEPYLTQAWAGAPIRVGPHAAPHRNLGGLVHDDTAPHLFQAATPEMQIAERNFRGDETIVMSGFFRAHDAPATGRRLQLPGVVPIVSADLEGIDATPIEMRCDTLELDTDVESVTLTFRGVLGPLASIDQVRRIVLSLERLGLERDPLDRLSDTQRGTVHFAWTEDDASKGIPPPQDDAMLELHRLLTAGEAAPEPRVPIERYATVTAELAEWPDRRDGTLDRHGFTEMLWLLEERCWLERFARDATEGDNALVMHFGELFLQEQDRLSSPEELRVTPRTYVELRVAIEDAADVSEVLGRAKLGLAQWMRIDRRMTARAESDPAFAEELESILFEFDYEDDEDDAPETGREAAPSA